jgi:hypothetical protein
MIPRREQSFGTPHAPPHVDLALARIEEFAADAPAGVEIPMRVMGSSAGAA